MRALAGLPPHRPQVAGGVECFRAQHVADAQGVDFGDRLAVLPHDDRGVGLQPERDLEGLSATEKANRLLFGDVHGASVRRLTPKVNTLTDGTGSVQAMPRSLMERARFARLRAGYRLPQEAAEAIGCSRPLVLSWENGGAKSIGGKYLLAVAKAYRVNPDWLALTTDADGFPYEPVTVPPRTERGPSHVERPEPVTLRTALDLLAFDEDQAGPYSPMRQAERLSELYARVAADGGVRLSDDSNALFDDEVWARARRTQQGTPDAPPVPTPSKPGRSRHG